MEIRELVILSHQKILYFLVFVFKTSLIAVYVNSLKRILYKIRSYYLKHRTTTLITNIVL